MVIDIDKFQFIGVFDCTHFEVSVRTFQGLYANRIKIGTCTHYETLGLIHCIKPLFLCFYKGLNLTRINYLNNYY